MASLIGQKWHLQYGLCHPQTQYISSLIEHSFFFQKFYKLFFHKYVALLLLNLFIYDIIFLATEIDF